MSELEEAIQKLREEFGVEYDETVKDIENTMSAIRAIIYKLLPDRGFLKLNLKCIFWRALVDIGPDKPIESLEYPPVRDALQDAARKAQKIFSLKSPPNYIDSIKQKVSTLSPDKIKLLHKEFEDIFATVKGQYTEKWIKAGAGNWPAHFLRGHEDTPQYWKRQLREQYGKLRELGTKESFIKRNINSILGDISDLEQGLVRYCYDKDAKEEIKDLTEYITEDSRKICGKELLVVAPGDEKVILGAQDKKLRVIPGVKVSKIRVPYGVPTDRVVKTTKKSSEVTKLISERIGPVGNMLWASKSGARALYGDRAGPRMLFNSNIFTSDGSKTWYGDLLLGPITVSLLKQISAIAGTALYVLYESSGRFLDFIPTRKYLETEAVLKVEANRAWLYYSGHTKRIAIPV